MTTRAHINPYELDTEVDLGVDTQADTALPDEIGLSLQDSMTEKSSLPFVLQFPQSQDVRKKNTITKSSDNSTCRWTGEVINEQDQERFYASFSKNGEEYTLDESVLATSPNKKLPTIGQIHCLWEDKRAGKRIVELKVYYRPEETKEGRKPFQAPKELLDSNYFAQFTIDQVNKKCSVESYEKFRRRRDFPDDVYYFQDFYDYREQQTIEETPTDNFSFRRRIVNIALNNKSPVKSKEPLKSSTKATTNNATKINSTTKKTVTIEKTASRNSQQSTQKQNSKGSEPEIDDEATIKLTMPPIEDDEFDFRVIEELAGITNYNSVAKHSTNIQEASTLITTQRDVERKKSPSMSDDETTSGGSDKRSKVSPQKTPKASESPSSNSKTTLSVQPAPTRASKRGNSSPLVSSSLMTDDSEDMIMKELEIEEEEVTQAKPRSRITRQASTMDQSPKHSEGKGKSTKAQTPKKKQAKDESDEEFEDPEEEKPKPKTRGRPQRQAAKKQESEEEEVSVHEEPESEEEEKPKPKKTRAQAKKAAPKKAQPKSKIDSVEASDEEETAILEALERETEQLDAVRTNSAKKKKLRLYTDNDEDDQSDGEKSGPSSPTKIPQSRARGKSAKSSETPRKGTKSAFEFEGSEEKSDEEESPRKKRANRRLSVNSNDSKARGKKAAKMEVEEDVVENEDSISDSEEKKKWTSPRKNKGPASKREKIKEMLQKYPKLSELDNNDPFEDYDKANDVFEAATEPMVVDVEKFNSRTMKQALETEDNDFELDNFLKDTPRTKRQKQLAPLVTKNDFGSRLGSLSNRMKYYQNWDIAETKDVIEVDDDSQDNKKNSNNSIGSYSSRQPKNRSAQMKLDFAPITEKTSPASYTSRSNNNSGTNVKKSPYFSSNQQSTPPSASKVKVKSEHDPFISSILSKYDEDEAEEKDKEIIDLSTQRPASQVVATKVKKPIVQAVDEDDDFKSPPKKEMEDFNDFDVETMLREVGAMGADDSEPKDSPPVIAIDEGSLDGHNNNVSKVSARKKVDTSPSSDNNSESSTTRDSKKRKRGSDERKQRTLGSLNIIGAPEPRLLAEPPKKKRRLSEHIDRVQSKLKYGMDEDEVFVDKEDDEEMDDELRDFIVDDGVELSQYESQALPIDDMGDEESARDEAASQSSDRAFADKLVKEGETKFLSTTFRMGDAFKIFVQYIISCMLDPNFAIEVERKQDDYFRPAVRKIHDDLFSKKEVIIRSSAWNAQFKHNLDRLPVFRSYNLSHPEGECDACKRSMHTASWQIVLEGVSYDATSYWKDGPTPNNPNPQREPEQYTYNLGRFCHKRTELFHRLHHYKIRLNEQITERMNQLPSSMSENEVIDTLLDDQLWINRLYKQFQGLREDALKFGTKGTEDGHD